MKKQKVKLPPGLPAKHGGFTFLSTGRLPRHRRYIRRYLTEVRQAYISEVGGKGGEEGLSPGQRILIDRLVTVLGFLRLIEEKARESGIFKGDDLIGSLGKSYIAFLNSGIRIVEALGIEKRKADGAVDILGYIKEFDRKKARAEARARRKAAREAKLKEAGGQGEGEEAQS